MRLYAFLLIIAVFTWNCSGERKQVSAWKVLELCKPEGVPDSIYCGKLAVYENRQSKSGRKIDLHVILIPAIDRTAGKPPIFYVDGGPGVAATSSASFFAEPGNVYRQQQDVVLVDVRGTGESNPLHCNTLQYKASLEDHFAEMYPVKAVRDCYDSLSVIADLSQYTTENVVSDLEEIRQWLGYDKIHLMGLSYGTRVVQVYMKMFPQFISSSILWSPVIMAAKMPLYHARFAEDAMKALLDDCGKDSVCASAFPNIRNEFAELANKWKQYPMAFAIKDGSGKSKLISVGWDAFQTRIRALTYSPWGMRTVPYLIHEAWKGNLRPFVDLFPAEPIMDDFLADGFYLCITCAEDIPFIRQEEIAALTQNTFMDSYRIDQQLRACSLWARGRVSDDFLEPVRSSIPTLILSGALDPVTPVAWAKEIASHLTNSTLVIIPQMSHTFDGLSDEDCFDKLILDFISNPGKPALKTDCVEQMKPPPYKTRQ